MRHRQGAAAAARRLEWGSQWARWRSAASGGPFCGGAVARLCRRLRLPLLLVPLLPAQLLLSARRQLPQTQPQMPRRHHPLRKAPRLHFRLPLRVAAALRVAVAAAGSRGSSLRRQLGKEEEE